MTVACSYKCSAIQATLLSSIHEEWLNRLFCDCGHASDTLRFVPQEVDNTPPLC